MDQQISHGHPDATTDMQDAVEQSPKDYQKIRDLALSLLHSGKFAEAAEEFRSAIQEYPKSAELYTLLSIALERLGRTDEAVSAAEDAARLDDGRHARVGELHLSSGRVGEARTAFEQAIAAGHDSAHIQYLLSIAFERQGHLPEAMASAHRAVELEPHNPRWTNELASLTARAETAAVRAEIELAEAARRRGDWEESLRLWERVRVMAPDLPRGYSSGSEALRVLRRYQDAGELIDHAVGRFPDDAGVASEYARVASEQKDWDEARVRWDSVISRFPNSSVGYVGKLAMLRVSGQFAEAEPFCAATIERFPDEHAPLIEHAWLAQSSGAWTEAAHRWEKVREVAPHHLFAYTAAAAAYWEQRRFDGADAVLREAMERFPDRPAPFTHFAELATRQNDWPEALKRWLYVTEHFANDPDHLTHVHRKEVARMRLLEIDPAAAEALAGHGLSGKTGGTGAYDGDHESDPDMRDVMLAFESLGGQMGGCEFGNVQRAFGAEPLSLLRWAEMAPEQLILALERKFEGVGEPEQTELGLHNNGGRNEYRTVDRRFGMVMHTFIHEDEITYERMYTQSCRRLKYLSAKLVDDLHAGRKIFVYKIASRDMTDDELERLHSAIRTYGDTTLLYVRPETDDKKHGTVELVKPGLMVGYIDQFSVYREGGRLSDQSASWAPICLNAYRQWQRDRMSDPQDQAELLPAEASNEPPAQDDKTALDEPTGRHSVAMDETAKDEVRAIQPPDPPVATSGRGLAARIRSLFSAGTSGRR